MFTEMGWLDSNYNFDNATAEADVLSLPANVQILTWLKNVHYRDIFKVSAQISWEGLDQCIQDSLAMAAQEEWFQKCQSKYSDEEMAR